LDNEAAKLTAAESGFGTFELQRTSWSFPYQCTRSSRRTRCA